MLFVADLVRSAPRHTRGRQIKNSDHLGNYFGRKSCSRQKFPVSVLERRPTSAAVHRIQITRMQMEVLKEKQTLLTRFSLASNKMVAVLDKHLE
ncbi:unnamed protein product [Cylicocyclus nassatus]|uniref:Uncharacterized protein n=1 Tax=Cylicocyclus nassatus TaxID=53992 RepID=A0AA36M0K2_CYLNA|nr:unnamed protein product [Cylicocyclus nassatus]